MTLNYTNFQGIGIIGIVGVIYFSPYHRYSSLDWMMWVSLYITYFAVFWILPSHLLLKGLKKEQTIKCLILLLILMVNAIFVFLFCMFIKMLSDSPFAL